MPYLKKVNIPVVMIDRVIGREFDWVGVESRESTKEIVKYLVGLGHKKIGVLADFGELTPRKSGSAAIRRRWKRRGSR